MSAIVKSGGFALQPKSMGEALDMARMLAGSSMVPKQYQGRPEDTLVAMMMGAELGLNPIQSLQNIAVINGKPSIYGDALLALVQSHPSFGGIEESFDDSTMTARCTVWRKGGSKHTQAFSQVDATVAGLWEKGGPWKQYPKRMLQWRARGYALRDQFADALGGLITVEEARDMDAAPRDVTPRDPEPRAIPDYPAEEFEANLPKWRGFIAAGRISADDVIAKAESKGQLTDQQKAQIKSCESIEGEVA